MFKRLICWFTGHRYRVTQVFSEDTRRVGCDRCNGDWAMNDREHVIAPWSDEFTRFYIENGHLIADHATTNRKD